MISDSLPTILYFQNPEPLVAIAESLLSITPKVSVVEKDIYADFSQTQHLFGSPQKVLDRVEYLLGLFNCSPSWVLTEKINWAKALCLKTKNIYALGESRTLLLSLPVESLIVCGNPIQLSAQEKSRAELVRFLRKIGVHFCSDFLNLPTTSITHRFGAIGHHLLETLNGNSEPVLELFTAKEPLTFSIDTEDIFSSEALLHEIQNYLPVLEARLEGRRSLIQKLKLTFTFAHQQKQDRILSFSSFTRDPKTILIILRELLNHINWPAPLHRLTLEVVEEATAYPRQLNWIDCSEEKKEDLAAFIRRMRTHYGETQVGFPIILSNHLPERSWKLDLQSSAAHSQVVYPEKNRPLFIYFKPTPFFPNSNWHLTELERLTLFWWDESTCRHYFQAENKTGEKLWVFWEPQTKKWFCHGSFN